MSVGGATWDTAGTLELGSGNTFTAADATGDGDFGLLDAAWWVFTPTQPARVVLTPSADSLLVLYVGTDYASREDLAPDDFEGDDGVVFRLHAGVTYHLLVGHTEFVSPSTYQVTWTQTVFTTSQWFDDLQERDDNQLIVSLSGLSSENENPAFQTIQDWYDEVFGTPARTAPNRVATWSAIQELGGPDVTGAGAVGCVWSHVRNGDSGGEGGWDGTCTSLGTGPAGYEPTGTTVSWTLHVPESGGPGGDSTSADIALRADGLWFAAVREHLNEFGALALSLDPVADGYPADSELEWEGDLKLLKVELTGDGAGREPGTGDVLDPLVFMLRREVAPTYVGGDPDLGPVWGPFQLGNAQIWNGEKTNLSFEWVDGPPEWVEVDGVVSGDTGWEGLADPYTEGPDEVVVIGLGRALLGTAPADEGNSRDAITAVRFTFQSPRYRWVYTAPGTIPPRRIFGRSDGATHGARRALGGGNTRQSGSRTLGSIL